MINSLEIDSVQLSFGTRKVLQSIYLRAETGKVTGILGRNGCGKSSFMKVMFGELPASEMSLRLNGKALLSGYRNPSDMRMLPHYHFIPEDFRISRVFDDFEVDYAGFRDCFDEFKKFGDLKIGQLSGGNVRVLPAG
jgi:ABC-type multidrug transport system ATPase subunit